MINNRIINSLVRNVLMLTVIRFTFETAIYLQTLEDWAEFDIENAGTAIGESLADMIEEYPIENIKLVGGFKLHTTIFFGLNNINKCQLLIGHSIGAHIAGVAGRYLTKKTGKILPRITGLDPTSKSIILLI